MAAGEGDPADSIDRPPEGFILLGPAEREVPGRHGGGVRPGAGVVFALLIAVVAGLEVLQALIPSSTWRAVVQAAGVGVVFGGLGIWSWFTRFQLAAQQRCSCERPPVWIRVIPSVAQDARASGRTPDPSAGAQPEREEVLVDAQGVTRS
jgi:hypothetical protein